MDVLDRIKQQVDTHPVLIYMKGTPQLPQCGFSSRTTEALKSLEVEFAFVNVLSDPEIFQNLPKFADWPTFEIFPDRIKQQVDTHPVLIYMKGTPQLPQCGFSSRTTEALKSLEVEFAFVNVLSDPEIFQNLPKFADWPTFPQVYVDGELIGGCDITLEMHASGDLEKMVKDAIEKKAA